MLWVGDGGGSEPPIPTPAGWPAPFDAIQGFLEGAFNAVADGLSWAANQVAGWIDSLWNNLVGAFDSLWKSIIVGFDNLWEVFWLHSLPSWQDVSRSINDTWNGFVNSLGDLWTAFVGAIDALYHSIWDALNGLGQWIWARMVEVIGHWDPDKNRFVGGFLGWLWDAVGGVVNSVFGFFSGLGSWLTDCFDWLHSSVVNWLVGAMEAVAKALGDGLKWMWDQLTSTIPGLLAGAASWLGENVGRPIIGAISWIIDRITDAVGGIIHSILGLFTETGYVTGESALKTGILACTAAASVGGLTAAIIDVAGIHVLGSGIDLNNIGKMLTDLIDAPMYIDAVIDGAVNAGVRRPLQFYYNKILRPEILDENNAKRMLLRGKIDMDQYKDILAMRGYRDAFVEGFVELTSELPGAGDLITIAHKGSSEPAYALKAPVVLTGQMAKLGFSSDWVDKIWTSKYSHISMKDAFANFYRGLWTEAQLRTAFELNEIHPTWYKDMIAVVFDLPSVRDLGYGYDAGIYSREDVVRAKRASGLSPGDADKAATAMILYRTRTYRSALVTEALNDYAAGLDTEDTLRAKLEATGARAEVVDLLVERAKYRENRDTIVELIKVVEDQYIKGILTEAELRQELTGLGVKPDHIELHVFSLNEKKVKAAKAETAAKKQKLSEANLTKAWELGLIGDVVFLSSLVERGYTQEDAQLILNIHRTPQPVTQEEIDRRKNAILSKEKKAQNKYELLISRLDAEISLLGDEIETAGTTLKDSLDVFDTQLTWAQDELVKAQADYDAAAATLPKPLPEWFITDYGGAVTKVQKQITLLTEKREIVVSRGNQQLTRLKDNLNTAADRKAQLLRMRDEEIADYENELASLKLG